MNISRPLAWALILLTVVGSSLIRQLHDFIPEWAPLTWPVRSPLYAFLVILFLLLLAASRPETDSTSRRAKKQVFIGCLVPVLIALVYEKVLSVTLYEALLDHTIRIPGLRDHLDAWIHIVIGIGMVTAVLLLAPLMRGVRIKEFFSGALFRSSLYLQAFSVFFTYGLLVFLLRILGGSDIEVLVLFPHGAAAVMLLFGQGMRAMAEEFYYRGLLQREMASLMESLGIRSRRSGQAIAVALISFGFGIEHFRFGAPLAESYRGFAYALAVGFLFGYLLILTGNVFFCGLAHATNNLVTEGLAPKLATSDGNLLISGDTFLYVYLIVVFLIVFAASAVPRGNLRRAFLPGPDPPLHA